MLAGQFIGRKAPDVVKNSRWRLLKRVHLYDYLINRCNGGTAIWNSLTVLTLMCVSRHAIIRRCKKLFHTRVHVIEEDNTSEGDFHWSSI